MGGVNYNDQMTHLRKEKKWYIRLIIKINFDVMSCYNSYLVFKHFYPEFKEQLATHDRFVNVGEHLPEKGEGKNH